MDVVKHIKVDKMTPKPFSSKLFSFGPSFDDDSVMTSNEHKPIPLQVRKNFNVITVDNW
jgi:hypothetical protein